MRELKKEVARKKGSSETERSPGCVSKRQRGGASVVASASQQN